MKRYLTAVALLATVISGCSAEATPTEATACPTTVPVGDFLPPSSHPPQPSTADSGDVWFGTDELFTVLPADGIYRQRKSVWWSTEFPGGDQEEQPPITVTWTRLDDPTVTHTHSPGTNAFTGADGWFIIAGIDPDEAGCWQVEATYKGATLTYVYERS
jgi:hypothetical protein